MKQRASSDGTGTVDKHFFVITKIHLGCFASTKNTFIHISTHTSLTELGSKLLGNCQGRTGAGTK